MSIILTVSTLLAISSNSWLIIWVFIEINSLAICSLISNEINNENENNSQALIYLVIQLTSSIIFLSCVQSANTNNLCLLISIFCLLINTGTWPFHLWYLNTLSLINVNHNTINIIITWQNLIPMLILPYFSINFTILILSIITILTPIVNINNESSFNTIIASSSLNNNGWLILTTLLSTLTFIIYIAVYSLSLVLTLSFFNNLDINNSLNFNKFWESILTLGNIGGVPPFLIFSGNLIIVGFILISSTPNEIPLLIIAIACLFIYHYIWSTSPFLSKIATNTQLWNESNSFIPQTILTITCLVALSAMLLGLTNKGLLW